MIIEFMINYAGDRPVTCCGEFRDWRHFVAFKRVEATYGREVSCAKVVKR